MAPGVAWIDFDRDGDLDVIVATGRNGVTRATGSLKNADARSSSVRLFRQDERRQFQDVTNAVELFVESNAQGFTVGDFDNDGFDDVLVTGFHGDRLLRNDRAERFVDVTDKVGIGPNGWSTSAAFFDFDRDGWLDLFVCQYVNYDASRPCFHANGREDFCNPAMFERTTDKLYQNLGGQGRPGEFQDCSERMGITAEKGAGLGVICGDFNGDGWQDLYVANDGHENFLWMNQEGKSFRNEGTSQGVAYDLVGRGQGSMGVAAEDLNGDAKPDLFVTNLDGENNALYLSDPQAGFIESSSLAGLARPSYASTGFGTGFLDVFNSGNLDLAVANGRVRRRNSAPVGAKSTAVEGRFWDDYAERNQLYLNRGDGQFMIARGFNDPFVTQPAVSRGLAIGDFDNDGRVDMMVSVVEGPVQLFHNISNSAGHWISLRLVDSQCGGRIAFGAIAEVRVGDRVWHRQATSAGSYLSAHDSRVHFGLGAVERIDELRVTWPDGKRERFSITELDRVVTLARGMGHVE